MTPILENPDRSIGMTKIRAWFKDLANYAPATLAWALNGGAVLLATLLGATRTEEAAVITILSTLSTIYTAVKARPVDVALIVGGLITVLEAFAAFGLHLPASRIAGFAGAGAVLLSLLFGLRLDSVATIRDKQAGKVTVKAPGRGA